MPNPTTTKSWKRLVELSKSEISESADVEVEFEDFYLNFSRNKINQEVFNTLLDLAQEMDLSGQIKDMFSGGKINQTENREVLHTALRDFTSPEKIIAGNDILPGVKQELSKVKQFCKEVIEGDFKGSTGKSITDIVNIGIGGSDLGPRMASQALKP